jgi:hypothetical protein
MMTDQNSAGRSRAAQAQYLRGVDQKYGAGVMTVMLLSEDREEEESDWIMRSR